VEEEEEEGHLQAPANVYPKANTHVCARPRLPYHSSPCAQYVASLSTCTELPCRSAT